VNAVAPSGGTALMVAAQGSRQEGVSGSNCVCREPRSACLATLPPGPDAHPPAGMVSYACFRFKEVLMPLLKARRFWQIRRRYAVWALACSCGIAFTFGCKSGKPTGPAASPQQSKPVAVAQAPVQNRPLQAGAYQGRSNDGDFISVKLVKVGQRVLVKSVGHKFSGSGVGVDAVTAKDGKPFGTYELGVLKFPITFMVKFNPVNSILTASGGQVEVANYDCTLLMKEQENQLTLVANRTNADNGFAPSFSDIEFSTPASGFKMKDSYEIKLQEK